MPGILFWTCPVEGHSDGRRHARARQTVEWRGNVAYCLAPDCERTSINPIPDDGRTWWILGAALWPSLHIYQAGTAHAALTALRRDITLAERRNGRTARDIRRWLTDAGLYAEAGPLGTKQTYEFDLARSYADEITRWSADEIPVPVHPDPQAVAALAARLGPEVAARTRIRVRARYLPRTR